MGLCPTMEPSTPFVQRPSFACRINPLPARKNWPWLRRLFMERCRWEWLFGIENRDKIFPIHRSYKFNPVVIEKGGATEAIRTAFMCRSLDDWERADDISTSYTRAQVERFSPRSRAILEIQSSRDLEILEKIYANAVLLGDDGPEGWGIRYAREFDMTNDSRLFSPRPRWEAKGYRPDEYSRWLLGDWRPIDELWAELGVDPSRPEPVEIELEDWLFDATASPERREADARFVHGHLLKPGDVVRTDWRLRCAQPPYDRLPIPRANIPPGVVLSRDGDAWIHEDKVDDTALPLYEGRMIGPSDFSQKGWVSGRGRRAVWREIPWGEKRIEPQFLMAHRDYELEEASERGLKLAFMDITSSTNARTMIVAPVADLPCGNKTPVLTPANVGAEQRIDLIAFSTSITLDWAVRQRLSGITLNWHIAESLALPAPDSHFGALRAKASQVMLSSVHFAGEWIRMSDEVRIPNLHACSPYERFRIFAMVDAVAALIMGFSMSDLRYVLTDCDQPRGQVDGKQPKGFWRVAKDKDPELRHTVLTLIAFHDLEAKNEAASGNREKGINTFLAQNDGEGWMLPETLCLADYGLGHDERARDPQPVASRLGPRCYDWQLVQSAGESWRECHLHARNILGRYEYALLLVEVIERRATDDEDYLDPLTDGFTRELLGDDGYTTVLVEICARSVAVEASYWTIVADLRDDGHLDDHAYGELLDKLHSRGHLDDIGYRRRRGYLPPSPSAERWLRAAEDRADYRASTSPEEPQSDLFE